MATEKIRLLARESIYWVNIYTDIEVVQHLECKTTPLKDKLIPHEIPDKPWETVGADILMLNNKTYLCNVDNQNKFPVMKLTGGLDLQNIDFWENNIWCLYKFCFRKLLGIPQVPKYPSSHILPEQWRGKGMYKVNENHHAEIY